MKFVTKLLSNPRMLVPMGVVLAVGFLLLDAAVDTIFFDSEKKGFIENLLEPEPMDSWMRLVVMIFVIGFAFYSRHLLRREMKVSSELDRERALLVERVAAATHELRERNATLEHEVVARRKAESQLETLAITDPLTQLYNRRKLLEELTTCMDIDRRYHTGLALILCDIDNFKQINDQHGHGVGDAVLCQFSDVMRCNTRASDTLARWGGEEFALLMPLADTDQGVAVAEKLRLSLEQTEFNAVGHVTASFGVAMLRSEDTTETFMQRADKGLYAAKAKGRNAVVLQT